MASSNPEISTAENEEDSGELFADLPAKSKRPPGAISPPSAPRSQVKAAASLVGAASQARPMMPSSSGVHTLTSPVPPAPQSASAPPPSLPVPPRNSAPPPPSMRPSAPSITQSGPPIEHVEYAEDNGDDATPVRTPTEGTPTVKLPDVSIVAAMTRGGSSSAAPPPPPVTPPPVSMPPSAMVPPPSSQHVAQATPPVSSIPQEAPHSAPPMSLSQPPPVYAAPPPSGSGNKLVLAAAALLLVAAGALVLQQSGLAGFGAKEGTLLASVAGPGGAAVDKFELFVDGSRRCEASPCKVDGLSAGEHFVKVVAPGYESSAAVSVKIESGATKDHRVELVVDKSAPADAKADKPSDTLSVDDLSGKRAKAEEADAKDEKTDKADTADKGTAAKVATGKAPVAAKGEDKAAAKDDKADPAAGEKGTINISSTPPSNVVVDGKPIGMTPKTVRVSPGQHTIVFIGAEGRQVRGVNVKAGGSTSVAVKF